MDKEKQFKRHYKVEAGDIIKIKRQDVREYTFYKVALQKKNADGTKAYYDKNIAFPKGTDLSDGTMIKVIDFFEDVYARPNDKYNANWTLFISEYEIVEQQDKSEAISEFNDLMENVEIDESDINF